MRFCKSICFAILFNASLTLPAPAAEHTKDSLAEIKKKIDREKAVLVDVREKKEWEQGHVKGALLLPTSEVQDGLTKEELKPLPKDKILYVHCVVGARALKAASALERHGYTVRAMKPGYKEMVAAGFPKAKE